VPDVAELLIGDRVYRRKADALVAVREIRDRVKATGRPRPEDDEFLRDLLALHPDAATKVGVGVERFEVRRNFGNTDGFWIVRTDGSETDFSFPKCLYGSSKEAQVRSAMRCTIIDQIQHARDRAFGSSLTITCEVTREQITRETCHMDHNDPPFIEIADAFAAEHGGYEAIETVAADGEIGRRFVEDALAEEWSRFHAERAKLRPVSKKANLSILRRGVARRIKLQ
jgi:hypothetical protein